MRKEKFITDLTLFAVLILLGLGWLFLQEGICGSADGSNDIAMVRIQVDGQEYGVYPLNAQPDGERKETVQRIEVKTERGINVVCLQDGIVWVEEADCPDQICVKEGKISGYSESIVCLPHRMVIEIVEKD